MTTRGRARRPACRCSAGPPRSREVVGSHRCGVVVIAMPALPPSAECRDHGRSPRGGGARPVPASFVAALRAGLPLWDLARPARRPPDRAGRGRTWSRSGAGGGRRGAGCWSPVRAARSGANCAGRSPGSRRRGSTCSTTTSRTCTACSCGGPARAARRGRGSSSPTSGTAADASRCSPPGRTVVFHAAALKHLPLLERHPCEGVKSNVLGTQNLIEAALEHGAARFVMISTDKAADPSSVLGATKRLAELVGQRGVPERPDPRWPRSGSATCSARGSLLPVLAEQVAARRAGHRHPPGRDAVLHDRRGGGRAGVRGGPMAEAGRDVRARHGRAGPRGRRWSTATPRERHAPPT